MDNLFADDDSRNANIHLWSAATIMNAEVMETESLSSTGGEGSDDNLDELPEIAKLKPQEKQGGEEPKRGGVRFGSIRVRKHNLTLGDNPGAKTFGPPVTMEWQAQESERFATDNDFSIKYHGTRDSIREKKKPARIDGKVRAKIAAKDHSAGSIRKLQMEMYEIKKHREESASEDPSKVAEKRGEKGCVIS